MEKLHRLTYADDKVILKSGMSLMDDYVRQLG